MPNMTMKDAIRLGARIQGKPLVAAKIKAHVQKCGEYDSKAEAAYAERLAFLLGAKEIRWWRHHPFTLRLADKKRYTPDFAVWHNDGSTEIVEVKGYERRADVLTFKWAQDAYPIFKWTTVRRVGRGIVFEVVRGG